MCRPWRKNKTIKKIINQTENTDYKNQYLHWALNFPISSLYFSGIFFFFFFSYLSTLTFDCQNLLCSCYVKEDICLLLKENSYKGFLRYCFCKNWMYCLTTLKTIKALNWPLQTRQRGQRLH